MDGFSVYIKVISPRTRDGSWAADQYVIVGPDFKGSLPSNFDDDHTIRCLSRFAYVITRIEVSGVDDVPNGLAIQSGYTLTSLNGKELKKTDVPVFPFLNTVELAKSSPEAQVFSNFIMNYMKIEDIESDLFRRFARIEAFN